MTEREKEQILISAKDFFKNRIAKKHNENTEKLAHLSKFNVNPFTWTYLAKMAFGSTDSESLAKALIYPRVLGTSISTTFGTSIQFFSVEVLGSYASTAQGMDIEFEDAVDGHHKYCQLKAGPNTINKDDIKTIEDHFRNMRNLRRTNGGRIPTEDCVVGVLYGDFESLSSHYKKINEDYPVIVGKDFWYHLTGDEDFYSELVNAFVEVVDELTESDTLERTVRLLAYEIERQNGAN